MTAPVFQRVPAPIPGGAQGKSSLPLLWNHLTPQARRQLAQQMARMIRQMRETASQEKSRDERG